MAITDEQAKYIKEQIGKQLESMPEDKREQIKQYIFSLNNEQLEEFLIKNKMLQDKDEPESNNESDKKCIFCLISNKKIESFSVYEDKEHLAVLELNPISEGHILLIPKEHIKEAGSISKASLALAEKLGKELVKKLDAENFQILPSDELKHAVLNIIPSYKGKKADKRKQVKKEELESLKEKIGKIELRSEDKKEEKQAKQEKEKKPKPLKLSRRIP